MGRRKILLPLAAVIAAARHADGVPVRPGRRGARRARSTTPSRCSAPSSRSTPARRSTTPPGRASSSCRPSPQDQLLDGSQTDLDRRSAARSPPRPIYPGEQITDEQVGRPRPRPPAALAIPKGMMAISVNLTDPGRVAGLRQPRLRGRRSSSPAPASPTRRPYARLLLPRVTGARHRRHLDHHVDHDEQGRRADDRGDPADADDARRRPGRTPSASSTPPRNGKLSVGLLTKDTRRDQGRPHAPSRTSSSEVTRMPVIIDPDPEAIEPLTAVLPAGQPRRQQRREARRLADPPHRRVRRGAGSQRPARGRPSRSARGCATPAPPPA